MAGVTLLCGSATRRRVPGQPWHSTCRLHHHHHHHRLLLREWRSESVGLTNANGRSFVLTLLPAQPAGSFTFGDVGTQRYSSLCAAAGLHTVTTGDSSWGAAGSNCMARYGCITLPVEAGGGEVAEWVHAQTGK
jgi:hypothetical protein